MHMTLTVIPSTLRALNKNLTEVFEITNPFVTASEGGVVGWNEDVPVQEILLFVSEYHKRLSQIIGELVILVNFEEETETPDENAFLRAGQTPRKRFDYSPSMN